MNPITFLNGMFMFAAGEHFAKHVDERALEFDDPADLVAVSEDGVGHDFPEEGQERYKQALADGESPNVCWHPEHGWFVTHAFDEDEEDEGYVMRMVCWAEMGEQEFSAFLAEWWKENNPAYKDGGLLDDLGIDGGGWRADRH